MDTTQFLLLVTKQFAGTITPEENNLLQKTVSENDYYREKYALLQNYFAYHNEVPVNESPQAFQAILEKINATPFPTRRLSIWYKIAVAAIFAGLIISAGLVYTLRTTTKQQITSTTKRSANNSDVAPGKDRAVLTLSDGSHIDLDSLQNNVSLHGFQKQNGNEVVFNTNTAKEPTYNTLSTPQGGKYKVILPDGSTVWLNAASSLHFPTVFDEEKREVTLTGEAYFEIKENRNHPFVVKVKDMSVDVLGTHFNVNAYENERTINTTLLEGSVKVSQGGRLAYLKPGQQAIVNTSETIRVNTADMEEVMAWKNDLFVFKGYDFDKVMRQLARWYDVAVEYKSAIPAGKYSGVVGRNNNISVVLKMLKTSGVSFKIENKKIIIE